MPDVKLPGNVPDTPEAKACQERLTKIMDKIEALLKAEMLDADLYFLALRDTKAQITAHTGNGCAACAIISMVRWGLETQLRHDEGGALFSPVPPVPIGFIDGTAFREMLEKLKLDELDEDDPDTPKH